MTTEQRQALVEWNSKLPWRDSHFAYLMQLDARLAHPVVIDPGLPPSDGKRKCAACGKRHLGTWCPDCETAPKSGSWEYHSRKKHFQGSEVEETDIGFFGRRY